MVFSSLQFLFLFLPVFLVAYYFIPKKYKNAWLFLGSVGFYTIGAWQEPVYIIFLIFSAFFNFYCGLLIERGKRGKFWLFVGLAYNIGWLGVFKYADFFMETANWFLSKFGSDLVLRPFGLTLPIGISFYTFQAISYLIDVKRRDVTAATNVINFGAYLTMFPQLIAGPIVRYSSVSASLKFRRYTIDSVIEGLKTFILGLGLKVALANRLGGLWTAVQGIGFDYVSWPVAVMGILAFTFQLYFDFWGYSLMAIGLGRMLGFEFPQNFNNPYISVSMTEFWRRWHMTLGSWFREYVYIPLGGNRKGKGRTYVNLFVVWALTGLWHGANWNFVLWGLLTFLVIAIEKAGLLKVLESKRWLGHIYMIILIPLMWAVFAITDLHDLGTFMLDLIPHHKEGVDMFGANLVRLGKRYGIYLALGVLFSTPIPQKVYEKIKDNIIGTVLLLAIFWYSVYCIYMGMNDPFLYFRF